MTASEIFLENIPEISFASSIRISFSTVMYVKYLYHEDGRYPSTRRTHDTIFSDAPNLSL